MTGPEPSSPDPLIVPRDPIADEEPVDEAVDEREFPDLVSWVEGWLLQVQRRKPRCWCRRWWDHPEAVSRLGTLWAAWETAQAEKGQSPSLWWVTHHAHHWAVITGDAGPFASCYDERCSGPGRPIPFIHPTDKDLDDAV